MTCPHWVVGGPHLGWRLFLPTTDFGGRSLSTFRQQLLVFSSVCLLRHRWLVTQPQPSTTGWTGFRGHRRLIESRIRYGDAWPARDFTVHCFLPSCLCTLLPHLFKPSSMYLLQHFLNPLIDQLASVFFYAGSKHKKCKLNLETYKTSMSKIHSRLCEINLKANIEGLSACTACSQRDFNLPVHNIQFLSE